MFKIKVLANSVLINLAISEKDYYDVTALYPEALVLKDDNGDEIFRVAYNPECPSVDEYGIVFDTDFKVTALCNSSWTKEDITKELTPIVLKLSRVCQQIDKALHDVATDIATATANIEFLD